jgi:hypothetical protein
MGASRTFAGHGSDGLVRIENASVWGVGADGQVSEPCATAYTYRSHSGFFGIVNSEEGYQNLTRFLFGDLRVDVWVDVSAVRLPPELQGKAVDASYQFELLASPRGKRWYLSRRIAEEDSVACRSHQQLTDPGNVGARSIFLSSVFLADISKVNPNDPALTYGLTFGVRVPDYEVDRKFWPDQHFEGAYLFHDSMVVRIAPPAEGQKDWNVTYDWQTDNPGRASKPLPYATLPNGWMRMTVPFDGAVSPGISGQLRFEVSGWN